MIMHKITSYKITLPDGAVREVPAGSTPLEIAAAISPGLAKATLATLRRQACEALVEYPHPNPADKAIINRLGKTIVLRCITPAQTVANDKNNPDEYPTIINSGNPMG
jgi:hypothetical protein